MMTQLQTNALKEMSQGGDFYFPAVYNCEQSTLSTSAEQLMKLLERWLSNHPHTTILPPQFPEHQHS